MLLQCAYYEMLTSLWLTGLAEEKKREKREDSEQCEPIYTSIEEPERCWGHAEHSTVSLTRRHVKHAHLTFNQYM